MSLRSSSTRRGGPTRAHRALLACALAIIAAPAAAPAAGRHDRSHPSRAAKTIADYDAANERWREGPVRYLLSKDEDSSFRALATDEERARFVERFWMSRDPVPTTPENEYRTLFFRRVTEADRLFTESTTPGWKTDRGKIYILLGPPDDLDQSAFARERRPDVVVWTYRNPPDATGAGINSTIRFVKDHTGEYRLSDTLPRSLEFLGAGFQVQAMQMKSIPEPREMLDAIVNTQAFFNAAPFRTHHDFFRATDGSTFTVLTLGARQELAGGAGSAGAGEAAAPSGSPAASAPGAPRFEVLARLVGEDPGLPTCDFTGAGGLRAAADSGATGPDGYSLYQGGEALKPGRYTAYYGIVDRSTNQLYSFKEEIAVPDLRDGGFSLSAITLASRLERIEGTARAGYAAPFVIGNLRVLPRSDDRFRNDEDLAFYYQVYGATIDPIDGRPDLDVEYRFFIVSQPAPAADEVLTPLGQPIHLTREQSPVQGYSLPLRDWPRATYRLKVEVTDNLGGRRSSGEATFRIP